MFRKVVLISAVILVLFVGYETQAGCRGRCGLFGGRAPVRSFFQNRQPVRRAVRGVARVAVAPARIIVQRRRAIRSYRQAGRVVAVPSTPGVPVTQLGPSVVEEQIVSQDTPSVLDELPTYYEPSHYDTYTPTPQYRTCGPYGCN